MSFDYEKAIVDLKAQMTQGPKEADRGAALAAEAAREPIRQKPALLGESVGAQERT